jgi:hypothetical protein
MFLVDAKSRAWSHPLSCGISPNGSVCVTRINSDYAPCEFLAEHYEGSGFALPMTVMIFDQRNTAARVTIAVSGEKTWH